MKKVAVVGAGIVGVTAAFYLKKNGFEVDIFDANYNQGTKAAVGIICPWVSQRRNKKWYQLAKEGADFYHKLIDDLPNQTFYKNNGTIILHNTKLETLYDIAKERLDNAPSMVEVIKLNAKEIKRFLPNSVECSEGIFVKGGSQVDGTQYIKDLLDEGNLKITNRSVKVKGNHVDGVKYDVVIVACGPWINDALEDMVFEVYPQKGQLIEFDNFTYKDNSYPVIMPQGEIDLLFSRNGSLVVGASHENFKNDTIRDISIESKLIEDAKAYIPSIDSLSISNYRIGIRAYTSKNEPFFGPCTPEGNLYVASGLGSSGLTTGPIIGYKIAQSILGESIDFELFSPVKYLKHNTV